MNHEKLKIAGCVILYNPSNEDLNNISTYISKVEKLYIYDNSEQSEHRRSCEDFGKKVIYFHAYENQGIAARLNQACNQAKADGFDYLLTMDQDSSFIEHNLDLYLDSVSNYPELENIAQFGLEHLHTETISKDANIEAFEDYGLITSASIVNLEILKKIGGFDENLFIDGVDFDYCLNARQHGFKCILFKNLFFKHSIGTKSKRRSLKTLYLFKKEKHISSPIRIYYLVRNTLYLQQKYGTVFPEYIKKLVRRNKTSVATNRNYAENLFEFYRYKRKAIVDFKNDRMGKINL